MSTNNEENFLAPFDAFLAGLDKHDEGEKLFIMSGLVELLRHTKSATDVFHMAELLIALMQKYVDWPRIPFSITKNLLSKGCHMDVRNLGVPEEHVPAVIRSGFLLFVDEFQANPDTPVTYETLWENIKLVAETSFPRQPEEPTANPKKPVASPEIFNPSLVRRVFEPAKFTPELSTQLRLQVATYRGTMPNGTFGPAVRGLAISADSHFNVFLETGEFLEVPTDYPQLVISTAPEDFKNINPAVLLMLVAAREHLAAWAILDEEQSEKIAAGSLGKIRGMHFLGNVDVDDLKPLEHVFDIGREAVRMGVTGATGPVGACVRFPVPSFDDIAIVLEAQQDSYGPYSHARLVQVEPDNRDVVIMRHEAPRHYSLRGVYLFPLKDSLVSLTVIF